MLVANRRLNGQHWAAGIDMGRHGAFALSSVVTSLPAVSISDLMALRGYIARVTRG